MLTVHNYERIRRAYYVEKKSIRQIGRELGHGYWTVRKALDASEPKRYHLSEAKVAPVLGAYKAQIEALLAENERLPRKQRYTSRKIYQDDSPGGLSRGGVDGALLREPTAQGAATASHLPAPGIRPRALTPRWTGERPRSSCEGEPVVVQLFVMRLCYSRKLFVMAFPTQRQEAFLLGHVQAFAHFEGIPQRISYDNLKTAVKRILEGRNREEQTAFMRFRSHYLFESRFCTPGQGHEKGGVESAVGYSRRNFLMPIPTVADFDELNAAARWPPAVTTSCASSNAANRPSACAGKRNDRSYARCLRIRLPAARAGKSRSTATAKSPLRPIAIRCRPTKRTSS